MEKPTSQTLSKREVCAVLGKSKRSVETYVRSGRLPVAYVKGKNGNTAVFQRSAVEQFKKELAEDWRTQPQFSKPRLITDAPAPAGMKFHGAVAARIERDRETTAALARIAAALPQPVRTLDTYVALDEAAKRSGLPKSYLMAQAKAG